MPFPDTFTLDEALARDRQPGQLAPEALLFRAWAKQNGRDYLRFATNVRLGEGIDPGDAYPASARRYAVLTTQKRADLVAFHNASVDLFEVKIQAHLASLGQIQGYRYLWKKEFPAWPIDRIGIICRHLSPDTLAVLMDHQVPVYIYPDVDLPVYQDLPPPE